MGTNNDKHALKGKILFKATVTNKSPLLISTGSGESLDFEIIRNCYGNPYIPSSGFAGMLKNSFETLDLTPQQENQLKYFWGTDADTDVNQNPESSQSHICIDNLSLENGCTCEIAERDSVHIDAKTNLAIDQHKLDYELIEPGARFQLNAEITVRNGFDIELFRQFISYIFNTGMKSGYQQGSFKTSGFGILSFSDVEVFEFSFPDKATKWFDYLDEKYKPKNDAEADAYKLSLKQKPKKVLRIEGEFRLKNSLIIRADSADPINEEQSEPDKVHLTRTEKELLTGNIIEKALLTGKSLKGVIRHRALKILKTKDSLDSETFIDQLFGFVKGKEQLSSKVKSFETDFDNAELNQVHPRVKIDRYTGGTIEGALMQSKPVWHKDEMIVLVFEISNWTEAEAGLLLLAMKDLINEDLPIGGEKSIGRGLLTGEKLLINGSDGTSEINIQFDSSGFANKSDIAGISLVNKWVGSIK